MVELKQQSTLAPLTLHNSFTVLSKLLFLHYFFFVFGNKSCHYFYNCSVHIEIIHERLRVCVQIYIGPI